MQNPSRRAGALTSSTLTIRFNPQPVRIATARAVRKGEKKRRGVETATEEEAHAEEGRRGYGGESREAERNDYRRSRRGSLRKNGQHGVARD